MPLLVLHTFSRVTYRYTPPPREIRGYNVPPPAVIHRTCSYQAVDLMREWARERHICLMCSGGGIVNNRTLRASYRYM